MRTNKIIILLLACLFSSCISSKAPKNWFLDDSEAYAYNSFGGYLFVKYLVDKDAYLAEIKDMSQEILAEINEYKTDSIEVESSGEFLGMKNDSIVFIDSHNKIFVIYYKDINYIQLELDKRHPGLYWALGGLLFVVTPFANGGFALFTGLITLGSTIGSSTFEGYRDAYLEYEPDINWFKQIAPYARFPQGITNEIDMSKVVCTYQIHYLK